MQRVIDKLNSIITLETAANMTPEQEHYLAGLADALQIIEETLANELTVGKTYFVIMYSENKPYIEEMELYRINHKSKMVYCFTRIANHRNPIPDLVLTSEQSLKARVFNSREEAEKHRDLAII